MKAEALETELENRWRTLAEANSQPKPGETWQALRRLYSEPDRHYHNLAHIHACLGWLDKVANIADDAVSLEFAIWFHDAIYDTHAGDNEAQSADFAGSSLVAPVRVDRVRDLILATQHREIFEGDAALICDIDLAILGASPDAYQAYRRQIREEYRWAPDADFSAGRIQVLRHFLARPAIFVTAPFRALEAPARANLEAEIRALSGGVA